MTRKEALEALLAKVEAGEFWAEMLRPPELHTDLCWKAYNGSHEAFIALHERLLDGWGWTMRSDGYVCLTDYHGRERWAMHGITARAGFIAIIKALISMEPEA